MEAVGAAPINMAMLETIVRDAPEATVAELCWTYNLSFAKRKFETD
jgi:hypothetical protein